MIFIYFLIFILGASISSFLSVYVERGNVSGRSICTNCKKILNFWELIPVFSYIYLAGKCSACKTKIPIKLFINELILGIWFLASFLFFVKFYTDIFLYLAVVFTWTFGTFFYLLVLEDLEDMSVSSFFVNVLISISILFCILKIIFLPNLDIFLEIVLPFLIISPFLIIYFINKNALGEADVYIFASIAFLFGSQVTLSVFLYSIWFGSFYGIIYLIFINKKIERGIHIPFLPIIFFSTLFVLIFNYHILEIKDILLLNEIFFS